LLEEKNDLIESEVEQFNNLKAQIEKLTKTKQETLEQINTITELSGLVVEIENFLKTKLAPVKYSKTLSILSNKTALTNLLDILSVVDGWSKEMRSLIPNNDFVEVLYESID
jgi:DNA repair exonuclease SbcCD ATPase subunit